MAPVASPGEDDPGLRPGGRTDPPFEGGRTVLESFPVGVVLPGPVEARASTWALEERGMNLDSWAGTDAMP